MKNFRKILKVTSIESILLGEQGLHGGEVAAELVGAHVRLLVRDPRLHHVRLPQQLQVRRVVHQRGLAARGQRRQLLKFSLTKCRLLAYLARRLTTSFNALSISELAY